MTRQLSSRICWFTSTLLPCQKSLSVPTPLAAVLSGVDLTSLRAPYPIISAAPPPRTSSALPSLWLISRIPLLYTSGFLGSPVPHLAQLRGPHLAHPHPIHPMYCRTIVRYGGDGENVERKDNNKQLLMTIPKLYNWQAENNYQSWPSVPCGDGNWRMGRPGYAVMRVK